MQTRTKKIVTVAALSLGASLAYADGGNECGGLPNWQALRSALIAAVTAETSGLDFQMWATVVNRDGVVCAVAFSGANRGSQWPGSRVISAQKANAANAFSLDGLALSTANLYSAVQPGGSLFGLQHSNPVSTDVAYGGSSAQNGLPNDYMVGRKIGGVNVFGGGLAMYNAQRKIVGAVGVSGDTSCADHMIAWRVRSTLALDYVNGGVSGDTARPDNIIYDIAANPGGGTGNSAGGFGHPRCINTAAENALPGVR